MLKVNFMIKNAVLFLKIIAILLFKIAESSIKIEKIKKNRKILQESYNYCCKILKNIVLYKSRISK